MSYTDWFQAAASAPSAAEVLKGSGPSSWYTPVVDMANDFSTWMEDNPTMAKAIGGAASAGLSYVAQKDQQKHQERLYDRRFKDGLVKASSGGSTSDSFSKNLVGGTNLLTNGLLKKKGA